MRTTTKIKPDRGNVVLPKVSGRPTWAINGRVLVATVVVGVVLSAVLFFVRLSNLQRTAPVLLEHAQRASDESDFVTAANYIRRYLKLRPNDSAARIQLAQTWLSCVESPSQRNTAIELLQEAIGVAKGEEKIELRRKLAENCLEANRFTSARLEAEKILASTIAETDVEDAAALRIRALAIYGQLQTGVLEGSRAPLSLVGSACIAANQRNPGDRQLAGILGMAFRERPELLPDSLNSDDSAKRARQSNVVMERLVNANPLTSGAYITRHLFRSQYRVEGALEDLEMALKCSDAGPEAFLVAARYHASTIALNANSATDQKELAQRAIQYYKKALQPKNAEVFAFDLENIYAELGEVYLSLGDFDAAIECWTSGLAQIKKTGPRLHLELAMALLSKGDLDEMKYHLSTAKKLLNGIDPALKQTIAPAIALLAARLKLREREFTDAITILKPLAHGSEYDAVRRSEALFLLGHAWSGLKDWAAAAESFERALQHQPDQATYRMMAAAAWSRQGDNDRAIANYQQLRDRTRAPELRLALAQAQYESLAAASQSIYDTAAVRQTLAGLKKLLQSQPIEDPWRVSLLEADVLVLEMDEVKQVQSPEVAAVLAELKKSESAFKDSVGLNLGLVNVYQKMADADDVDRVLDRLKQLTDGGAVWRIANAHRAQIQGNLSAAQSILETAMEVCPVDEHPQILEELVSVYLQRHDSSAAVEPLERWSRLAPNDARVRRLLVTTKAKTGQDDQLSEALKLLPATDHADISADDLRLRGQLLVQRGRQQDILTAVKIFEQLVNHHGFAIAEDRLMLAKLLVKIGKSQAARREYLQLASSPAAKAHHIAAYVDFLLRSELPEDAKLWIEKLRHLDPAGLRLAGLQAQSASAGDHRVDAVALSRAASDAMMMVKDLDHRADICRLTGDLFNRLHLHDDAEQWHRHFVKLNPEQFGPLALTLARNQKTSEAIALCSKHAMDDSTSSAATLLTSVLIIGKPAKSDFDAAMSIVEAAQTRHPQDVKLLMAVGNVHIVRGNANEAVDIYRNVIELSPQNALALNNLAMLLTDVGQDHAEGLKHIDRAIEIAGRQAELLDTRGMLLLATSMPAQAVLAFEEAAKIEAVKKTQSDPKLSFHLWAAYRAAGEHVKARAIAENVKSAELRVQILTARDRSLLAEFQELELQLVRAKE